MELSLGVNGPAGGGFEIPDTVWRLAAVSLGRLRSTAENGVIGGRWKVADQEHDYAAGRTVACGGMTLRWGTGAGSGGGDF